jgi:hypothetical protein
MAAATFETIVGKIRNPTAREFFISGMAAIRASATTTDPFSQVLVAQGGSAEFAEWLNYFDNHLRWRPQFMALALTDPVREVTLPRRWPRWFDPSFAGNQRPPH